MEIKFQNKIMLMSMFLCLFIFSGCYSTAVAVHQNDFSKTFNEYNLEQGNVYVSTIPTTIAAGDTIYITGVSNGEEVSMYRRTIRLFSALAIDVDVKLYEGGTQFSTTNVTSFNKNRNSDKNATFVIYEENNNPLSISGATLLPFSNKIKGDKKEVAETTDTADYIMKKDTIYILEITNNAPQLVEVILIWNWIELLLNN